MFINRRAGQSGVLLASVTATVLGLVAPASAGSSTTTVTFGATSVSTFAARTTYTINRLPRQIASVTCGLTPSRGIATAVTCGSRTGSTSTSTLYGVSLSGLDAGSYTYRATVRLTDGGTATGSTAFTIKSVVATCTVSRYSLTYDGGAHQATGSCSGAGGVSLTSDLNLAGTSHTNAGTYTGDRWSFTDPKGDYTNPGGTVNDLIGTATPSCSVTAYNATFTGDVHTAAGTCRGVGGADLSAGLNLAETRHTDAGSYPSDRWSFTDAGHNYSDASGTVADSIGAATAQCTVASYSVGYDGNAHTATGSCTGVGGADLSSDLNLSATTHTDAGSYATDSWTFHDATGNYTSPGGAVDDEIAAASVNCKISAYNSTYDGSPHAASGSCTGIGGMTLPAADLDLSGTAHTKAGNYTDSWSFTDPTGNYGSAGGTVNDVVGPATADCKVTGYGLIYDGSPHTATGTCTGIGGKPLPAADLDLSATTHTNAGGYTDSWTFSDPDYANSGGTVSDGINPATATCTVSSYSVTYDGAAHTASGSCTGLNSVALPASDLVLKPTAHTNVGDYTDSWYFADPDSNYINAGGSLNDSIGQAVATCTVTSYDTAYTGQQLTPSATCKGVNNVTLPAGDLDLSNSAHTDVGTYPSDSWTFADPLGNYSGQSGYLSDEITKAPVNCFVTGYSAVYDGKEHTATGQCVGAGNGVALPANELDLSATTHTNAGTATDPWSFTDTTGNYENASSTVYDAITPATARCTVTGYNVNYNGQEQSATGSCIDVNGATMPSQDLNLSASWHRNVGSYNDSWTFTDGSGNYTNPGGSVSDVITTTLVCTVTGYRAADIKYDGTAHTATGSCANGTTDLSSYLVLNQTTHTNAGVYNDTWTFHDPSGANPDLSGTVGDSIGRADATCTVTPYDVPFDGTEHWASGHCTDINGTRFGNGGLNVDATGHTNMGTYTTDSWSFNATNAYPNYNAIVDVYITDTITSPTSSGGGCSPRCVV